MRQISCTVGENISLTSAHVFELRALLTFVHEKADLGPNALEVLMQLLSLEGVLALRDADLDRRSEEQMEAAKDDPRY